MSYSASSIGTIPNRGFSWYVYLLEDGLTDALRRELAENIMALGQAVGPNALVVRGYEPHGFARQLAEAYGGVYPHLATVSPPALLVTDTAPDRLDEAAATAHVMVFGLKEMAKAHGSVADFLGELIRTLRDPDSLAALKGETPGRAGRAWGWLSRYVTIQTGLFGCSVNVSKAIGDAIAAAEGRKISRG